MCSKLTSLDDPQCSFLLLRYCYVTRVNHLARTVPPSLFSSTAGIHDMLTHQTFCAITGLDSVSDSHWQQAILPVKYGGLGLRSAAEISNAAYIAGWAQSTSVLPARFPYCQTYIDSIVKNFPSDHSISFHRHLAEELHSRQTRRCINRFYSTTEKKIQHKICEDIADTKANS